MSIKYKAYYSNGRAVEFWAFSIQEAIGLAHYYATVKKFIDFTITKITNTKLEEYSNIKLEYT